MSNSVDAKKSRLREQYLSARKALDANDVFSKSRFISSALINTDAYLEADVVHCYVSINRQNEVETRNLIQHMITQGKRVAVPKMEKEGRLSHYLIEGLEELAVNSWGVAEPLPDKSKRLSSDELDLIIVPMVSGDKHKNRLGYGKGFYDRFLEGTTAKKIGFLFDLQMYQKRLPTDKYDVSLDMLITETKIVS